MSPKKAGVLFFLFVVLHVLTVVFLEGIGEYLPLVYELIPSTLLAQGIILLPTLAFALLTPARLSEIFPFRKVKIRTLFLTLVMMAGLFPAIGLINYLSTFFAENLVENTLVGEAVTYPLAVMILLIGVVGPVCEEVVFRGYVYQSLRRSGSVAGSVLLSGLFFGLMHMNLNQASYAFFIGVFFALLTRAAGSLWPAILAHVSFNSFEVCLMYLTAEFVLPQTEESYGFSEIEQVFPGGGDAQVLLGDNPLLLALPLLLIVGAGILIALLCIRGIAKLEGRPQEKTEARFQKKPLFGIFTVAGVLFSVIFMLWAEGYL